MPSRTISIAVLNIVMNKPHSPEGYEKLIRAAFKLEERIPLAGNTKCLLGELKPEKEGDIVIGSLYKFIEINAAGDWFDANTKKKATTDEVDKIAIPRNLLPDFKSIGFAFNIKTHQFWYIQKDRKNNIGSTHITKFLQKLFDKTTHKLQLPLVTVTSIPKKSTVIDILNNPTLFELTIVLKHSNGDDTDWGARVDDTLTERNIDVRKTTDRNINHEPIKPTEEDRQIAMVAADQGYVTGRIISANKKIKPISTVDNPMIEKFTLNDDVQLASDVLVERATRRA